MSLIFIKSKYQTKDWRKKQKWYVNGKHNECEKYQLRLLEVIFNNSLLKTDMRLNKNNELIKSRKSRLSDTENFDYQIKTDKFSFLINLKFICEKGGAQTRTIKLVDMFIDRQKKFLLSNSDMKIYFINILDGDICHYYINELKENLDVPVNIFIGDMYAFRKFYLKIN